MDLQDLTPVDIESDPVANVVASPIQQQHDILAQQFDAARENRDPIQALDIAVKAPGTPVAQAAAHVSNLFLKGNQEYSNLTGKIEKAGGLGTPEGNLAAASAFQSTKDNPRYGDALIAYLLGDKKGARMALTGGQEFNKFVIDENGQPVKLRTNEAGDMISVQDVSSGKLLTPEEYAKRGIGKYASYENSLDYLTKKEQVATNTKEWNQSQKVNNNWAAFGQSILPAIDRIKSIGNQAWFKELPAEQQSNILKFSGGAFSSASNAGRNTSNLGQLQAMASQNEGQAIDKNTAASLGLPAGNWEWKGGMAFNKTNNQSRSVGELSQMQNSMNSSNELSNSFKQTQEDLAKYLRTVGKTPEQQAQIMDFLQTSHDIGQGMLRMVQQYGVPTYLYLPGPLSSVDQKSRVLAQAEQLELIPKLTQNFSLYSKGMLDSAKPGDILPSPGKAEAGFSTTPFYQDSVKATKDRMNAIVSAPVQSVAEIPVKPAIESMPKPKAPVAPMKGIPKGSRLIGKTPDGRDVYQSPDGKKHVED